MNYPFCNAHSFTLTWRAETATYHVSKPNLDTQEVVPKSEAAKLEASHEKMRKALECWETLLKLDHIILTNKGEANAITYEEAWGRTLDALLEARKLISPAIPVAKQL